MPRLYLLRHGIAGGEEPDPPLTPEGIAEIRGEAEGMARLGFSYDAIFTSPLRRARQTARAVAETLGMVDRVRTLEALAPGCRISALDGLGSSRGDLLLVGHAPDMGRIAAELVGAQGAFPLRRGGMCCVELDGWPLAPPGRLHFLIPPGLLLAAAGGRR